MLPHRDRENQLPPMFRPPFSAVAGGADARLLNLEVIAPRAAAWASFLPAATAVSDRYRRHTRPELATTKDAAHLPSPGTTAGHLTLSAYDQCAGDWYYLVMNTCMGELRNGSRRSVPNARLLP